MLSAITQLQHSVWHSKRSRWREEEVDRRMPSGEVAKKCPPVLRSWWSMSNYVPSHGRLADIDFDFEYLPMDPTGSSVGSIQAHLSNESTDFSFCSWSAGDARSIDALLRTIGDLLNPSPPDH